MTNAQQASRAWFRLLCLIMCALIGHGCIVLSLDEYASAGCPSFDKAMLGSWAEEGSTGVWSIDTPADAVYHITFHPSAGQSRNAFGFVAKPFTLEGQTFLDMVPVDDGATAADLLPPELNAAYAFETLHRRPMHSLAIVWRTQPDLRIGFLNPKWLQSHLERHPEALPHRILPDGDVLLAGPAGHLGKLLRSIPDLTEAFRVAGLNAEATHYRSLHRVR